MDHVTLANFKRQFEEQRQKLIENQMAAFGEDLQIKQEDMADETDLTSSLMEQSVRIRLKSREALLLKKLNHALTRIRQNRFHLCESCDERIGMKRLQARPMATLCIDCKEEQEREERSYKIA